MKPLYIKKNGQVEKVTGVFAMPATYPAERVAYDNTDSGLSADDTQGAIDEIVEEVNDKVDKEAGKGLSTNDFTNEDKALIGQALGNNTVLTTDKTPFLTRQTLNPTGFSGYVREKLIGCSVAWNQLVTFTYVGGSGYAYTRSLHSITINDATATNFNAKQYYLTDEYLIPNHVYYLRTISNSTYFRLFNYYTGTTYTANNGLLYKQGSPAWRLNLGFAQGITNGTYSLDVIITDLTLAFGSTIADYLYGLSNNGGITKLRDMGFPIDKYAPYGYGLYSVKMSGKKIVGFNTCDEIWESGVIDNNTGQDSVDANNIRTKNYIPCLPNTQYYVKTASGKYNWIHFYDAGKNWISGVSMPQGGGSVTTPLNAHYYRTRTTGNYGSVYQNDICINLYDSSKNGTYEPYCGYEISLGNDELRGKFDLVNGEIVASGDVKESNGGITRKFEYIEFDGSQDENWSLQTNATSGNTRFYCPFTTNAPNESSTAHISNQLLIASGNNASQCYSVDGVFAMYNNKTIYISGSFASDVATLKTKLASNPLKVVYTFATPTTEQSTPFADPMSLVGATTEEYIDTRDIPCPVGAERQYMGQSEDVVEIPSSPLSDGKRVLISEVSGGKEQVYWDIPKLYYKEYTVQGDGTKTYGDLLAELKPYYETLSEDEKTYSKVMMRATSSGNECLTFVGNYWYSRMGVNASGLWLDQIDFQYNKYFKQTSGGSITEYTNTNAAYNVFALRVLTYTRAE